MTRFAEWFRFGAVHAACKVDLGETGQLPASRRPVSPRSTFERRGSRQSPRTAPPSITFATLRGGSRGLRLVTTAELVDGQVAWKAIPPRRETAEYL
jgi:hypothetical protein